MKNGTRDQIQSQGYSIESEVTSAYDDWSRFALVISDNDEEGEHFYIATNNGPDTDIYTWSESAPYFDNEFFVAVKEANRMMGR